MVVIMLPLISKAFEMDLSTDKENIKRNDEIILKIKTTEKLVAANFEINYNNKIFKFLEGVNINAAEKDGKVACIYGDLAGKGEDEFLIKFKAIKSGKNAEFKIENLKCRAVNQEESYTDENILGEKLIKLKIETNNKAMIMITTLVIIILVYIIIIGCKKIKKNKN